MSGQEHVCCRKEAARVVEIHCLDHVHVPRGQLLRKRLTREGLSIRRGRRRLNYNSLRLPLDGLWSLPGLAGRTRKSDRLATSPGLGVRLAVGPRSV